LMNAGLSTPLGNGDDVDDNLDEDDDDDSIG